MQKIGYIGLGIMGRPMALNLIRKGYPLSIHARKSQTIDEFAALGAMNYATPKELAAEVDIIITNLPTSADVEEVLVGKNGVLNGAQPGAIVIDMSTVSVATTQRIVAILAKKKIEMLDAPVSGGEQGAIDGTLSIMVGGDAAILKKVNPIFNVLGKKTVHIGGHGAGQIAKACNQIIIAETVIAVSEALHLAKTSGVDPAKVREALLGGFANSRVLEVHGQRMLENNYTPGFKASLHRKDMHLALEQAHQVNAKLPAANYAMQCLDRLVMKGHNDLDSSAIHLLIEE